MEGILKHGTHTFLVRFWVEPREVAGEEVRVPAQVEFLGTGRVKSVTTAAELLAFVRECLDSAGVPVTEGWRAP